MLGGAPALFYRRCLHEGDLRGIISVDRGEDCADSGADPVPLATAVYVALRRRDVLAVYLLGMSICNLVMLAGIVIYIAKMGGTAAQQRAFLFLVPELQTWLQFLPLAMDKLGYVVAIGRSLFPLFALLAALETTMIPFFRRRLKSLRDTGVYFPCPVADLLLSAGLPSDHQRSAVDPAHPHQRGAGGYRGLPGGCSGTDGAGVPGHHHVGVQTQLPLCAAELFQHFHPVSALCQQGPRPRSTTCSFRSTSVWASPAISAPPCPVWGGSYWACARCSPWCWAATIWCATPRSAMTTIVRI